jgi:lipopolysaccharide/colanic/teichoic acid biosynthesis glycosyltransferase
MAKRTVDVILATLGLLFCLPLFAAIWLVLTFADPGTVFFRQRRVGQHGRLFEIIKFRTMSTHAEGNGPSITISGDQRVTRIGRALRKTKLDELPQLWNVLRGEMSLVGPRPELPQFVALYTPEQRAVLALKPGITDEASLIYRNEEQLLAAASDPGQFYIQHCIPQKIALNLAYARHASVRSDLVIILRTVMAVWIKG